MCVRPVLCPSILAMAASYNARALRGVTARQPLLHLSVASSLVLPVLHSVAHGDLLPG